MSARQTFSLYFLLSLLLYGASWAGLLRWPLGIAEQWFIIPVKTNVMSVYQAVTNLRKVAGAYTQTRELTDERTLLLQTVEELQHGQRILREENEQLRGQLNAGLPSTYSLIPATVTGVSSQLEIASGDRDGVKEGMSVIVGGTLIGKIAAVSEYRSRVMILTDPALSVPVRTSRGVAGVLSGRAGNQLIVDQILQKDPLFLQDQVYTTGNDGYPPNLLIGEISFITSTDVAVYKQAIVAAPVDYRSVRVVFIVVSR